MLDKKIEGSMITIAIDDLSSPNDKRLVSSAFNLIKNKGFDKELVSMIWSYRIMRYGKECELFK